MAKISESDRKKYEEAFRVSSGGQSTLPLSNLDQLLRICGVYVLPKELSEYKNRFGMNATIDLVSVLDIISREVSKEPANIEQLLSLFKALDNDNTGTISVAALQTVLCDPRQPDSLPLGQFSSVLATAGLTGVEQLSAADYMNVLLGLKRW